MKQHLCRLQGHSTLGLRLLGCHFIDELFRPVIGHPQGNNQHGTKRRLHIYDSTSFRKTYYKWGGGCWTYSYVLIMSERSPKPRACIYCVLLNITGGYARRL